MLEVPSGSLMCQGLQQIPPAVGEVHVVALGVLDAAQHQLALHILPVHHAAGEAAALLCHGLIHLSVLGHQPVNQNDTFILKLVRTAQAAWNAWCLSTQQLFGAIYFGSLVLSLHKVPFLNHEFSNNIHILFLHCTPLS